MDSRELLAAIRSILDSKGHVTDTELRAITELAGRYLPHRLDIVRQGLCLFCPCHITYKRLAQPHLAQGEAWIDKVRGWFSQITPAELTLRFSGGECTSVKLPSRVRKGDTSYKWKSLAHYLCPNCRLAVQSRIDLAKPIWQAADSCCTEDRDNGTRESRDQEMIVHHGVTPKMMVGQMRVVKQ